MALTKAVHSAPITLVGSARVKVGILMMVAILVDWAALVAEVVVSVVGADDQVGGRGSGRHLGLTWVLGLWERVENPSLVFAAPMEGNPIEF